MEHFMLQTQGVKILVVDDNQPNLLIAKGIMTRSGIAVTTATSGAEAVRYAKEAEYDLIVLDRIMPEMDGHETAWKLRALQGNHGKVPIVLYTSGEEQTILSEFSDVGIEDVLIKPLDIMELSRILLKYLSPGKIFDEQEVRRLLNASKEPFDSSESNEPKSLLRNALSRVPQMKYEEGLHYTGGTDENYLNVIRVSAKFMDEARSRLTAYANLGETSGKKNTEDATVKTYDIDGVRIDTHSLKGISAGIGLPELSKSSARLEQLAREGNEEVLRTALFEYLSELSRCYEALTEAILPLLREQAEKDCPEGMVCMEASAYRELWAQTEKSTALFDIDAIREGLCRLYAATEPGEKKDALKCAIECSQNFEYRRISELLERYREE